MSKTYKNFPNDFIKKCRENINWLTGKVIGDSDRNPYSWKKKLRKQTRTRKKLRLRKHIERNIIEMEESSKM